MTSDTRVFIIDKDVPIPPRAVFEGRKEKYPVLRQLNVGYSVFLSGMKTMTASSVCNGYAKRTGFRFTVRARTENGVVGTRVWRIE